MYLNSAVSVSLPGISLSISSHCQGVFSFHLSLFSISSQLTPLATVIVGSYGWKCIHLHDGELHNTIFFMLNSPRQATLKLFIAEEHLLQGN